MGETIFETIIESACVRGLCPSSTVVRLCLKLMSKENNDAG